MSAAPASPGTPGRTVTFTATVAASRLCGTGNTCAGPGAQIAGAITTTGNCGPGPYPGRVTTISGDHHRRGRSEHAAQDESPGGNGGPSSNRR